MNQRFIDETEIGLAFTDKFNRSTRLILSKNMIQNIDHDNTFNG